MEENAFVMIAVKRKGLIKVVFAQWKAAAHELTDHKKKEMAADELNRRHLTIKTIQR